MSWKIKTDPETPFVFTPGGSGVAKGNPVAFDLQGLAKGAYWTSGLCDLGPSPRPWKYWWQARVGFTSPPPLGEFVQFYAATMDDWDLSNIDGLPVESGTLPIVGNFSPNPSPMLVNLDYVGSVASDGTSVGITSGYCELEARYLYLVAYNNATQLSPSGQDHRFYLLPVPDEVQ